MVRGQLFSDFLIKLIFLDIKDIITCGSIIYCNKLCLCKPRLKTGNIILYSGNYRLAWKYLYHVCKNTLSWINAWMIEEGNIHPCIGTKHRIINPKFIIALVLSIPRDIYSLPLMMITIIVQNVHLKVLLGWLDQISLRDLA